MIMMIWPQCAGLRRTWQGLILGLMLALMLGGCASGRLLIVNDAAARKILEDNHVHTGLNRLSTDGNGHMLRIEDLDNHISYVVDENQKVVNVQLNAGNDVTVNTEGQLLAAKDDNGPRFDLTGRYIYQYQKLSNDHFLLKVKLEADGVWEVIDLGDTWAYACRCLVVNPNELYVVVAGRNQSSEGNASRYTRSAHGQRWQKEDFPLPAPVVGCDKLGQQLICYREGGSGSSSSLGYTYFECIYDLKSRKWEKTSSPHFNGEMMFMPDTLPQGTSAK